MSTMFLAIDLLNAKHQVVDNSNDNLVPLGALRKLDLFGSDAFFYVKSYLENPFVLFVDERLTHFKLFVMSFAFSLFMLFVIEVQSKHLFDVTRFPN